MTLFSAVEYMAQDPTGASDNAFIRKLSGLASLSSADEAALVALGSRARAVAAHNDLIREGDDPDAAFVVLEGIACRYRQLSDGRRQNLSFLLPGDLCDLDAVLLDRVDYAVGALSSCRVVSLSRDTLVNLLERHPQIERALRLAKLADEASAREWLLSLGSRSATERVAHLFCELLVRRSCWPQAMVTISRSPNPNWARRWGCRPFTSIAPFRRSGPTA